VLNLELDSSNSSESTVNSKPHKMLVGSLLKEVFFSISSGIFQFDGIPKQLSYTFEGRVLIDVNSGVKNVMFSARK